MKGIGLGGVAGVGEINGIKQYACDLANDMRIFCLKELAVVLNDINAVIGNLKKLRRKRQKKRPHSQDSTRQH